MITRMLGTSTKSHVARKTNSKRRPLNHRQTQQKSQWGWRSRVLIIVLFVMLVVNFGMIVFFSTQVYLIDQENRQLHRKLRHSRALLNEFLPELEELREKLSQLVKGRLPGLREIKYDTVIPINESYLKSIVFNVIKKGNVEGYEYKLIAENNSLVTVLPRAKIYFFSDSGIQVGVTEVGEQRNSPSDMGGLSAGEIRSYSATLFLPEAEKAPAYFSIRLEQEADKLKKAQDNVVMPQN